MNFVAACLVIGIEPFNFVTVQHIAQDHAAINGHIGQRFKLKQIVSNCHLADQGQDNNQ